MRGKRERERERERERGENLKTLTTAVLPPAVVH